MAPTKANLINSTGLIIPISYFVLFLVNVLILLLAHNLFPEAVVLGTAGISQGWALLHSMGTLALINTFMIPVVHYHEVVRGKIYSSREWMLAYFVINFIGIWGVARFADNLGFGISSWLVVLFLAVALDWIQGLAMMALAKLTT